MDSEPFQFKKFTILQNPASVFKVNTEAVLIAAWVGVSTEKRILEIGSGTGVIAIGLIQKISKDATVITIDIHEDAVRLTRQNIALNELTNIQVIHTDVQSFAEKAHNLFELIISNPPYFNTPLKSNKPRDYTAKYTDTLNYHELITCSIKLLKSDGKIAFIIPYHDQTELENLTSKNGLFINRICTVYSVPYKNPLRIMVEISRYKSERIQESLVIKKNNQFTDEYRQLTKDYYTIF